MVLQALPSDLTFWSLNMDWATPTQAYGMKIIGENHRNQLIFEKKKSLRSVRFFYMH